jgi:hypothetical protein
MTAKTINFTDLARDSVVKVTVFGIDRARPSLTDYINYLNVQKRRGYIVNFEA